MNTIRSEITQVSEAYEKFASFVDEIGNSGADVREFISQVRSREVAQTILSWVADKTPNLVMAEMARNSARTAVQLAFANEPGGVVVVNDEEPSLRSMVYADAKTFEHARQCIEDGVPRENVMRRLNAPGYYKSYFAAEMSAYNEQLLERILNADSASVSDEALIKTLDDEAQRCAQIHEILSNEGSGEPRPDF